MVWKAAVTFKGLIQIGQGRERELRSNKISSSLNGAGRWSVTPLIFPCVIDCLSMFQVFEPQIQNNLSLY